MYARTVHGSGTFIPEHLYSCVPYGTLVYVGFTSNELFLSRERERERERERQRIVYRTYSMVYVLVVRYSFFLDKNLCWQIKSDNIKVANKQNYKTYIIIKMPFWQKEKISAKDAAKAAKKETRREVRVSI